MMDNLTTHFSLSEMIRSQTATRKGIDNTPSSDSIINLQQLCIHILEPIRNSLGVVRISSGYRSPELNEAIGGSKTSQHCKGEAADVTVDGISNRELYEWIKSSDLPIDQCICEFPDLQGEPAWIHVSFSLGKNRRQFLVAKKVGRKTIYEAD